MPQLHGLDENDHDFYAVLDVEQDASSQEIKTAYRKALLQHHPDKSATTEGAKRDLDIIRLAYNTLSHPSSREQYDHSRTSRATHTQKSEKTGPRPSQVVSLDDFEEKELSNGFHWTFPCRCGSVYTLTEDLLEQDIHLVSCDSCSETIFVGYELDE